MEAHTSTLISMHIYLNKFKKKKKKKKPIW